MGTELDQYRSVTIGQFAGGALEELFQRELGKVLDNIQDPNIPFKPLRGITIQLSFSPDENRETCAVTLSVKSKITPMKNVGGTVFIARRGGITKAYEHNLKQTAMEFDKNVAAIGHLAGVTKPEGRET